jgi:hypothetical protein
MAVAINGSGTITGVSVGGLPDGIVDTDMLATSAVSAAKLAAGAGGKVLQVQTDEYTGTTSTVSQDTYGDIDSGFNVSITPASTNSKILVIVTIGRASVATGNARLIPFRVLRGTTDVGVGTVAGNRMQASFTLWSQSGNYGSGITWTYLDSPSSTSEQTYKVQWADQNGEGSFINRSSGDTDNGDTPNARTLSTITVVEISG